MDAHLYSAAIRNENAHRMAAAARRHHHIVDLLPPAPGPRLHRRVIARVRMHPVPILVPASSAGIVVLA